MSKEIPLIAGNPLELIPYNVTGNGKREWLKSYEIGQSAAEHRIGESSTTRRKPYTQVSGNRGLFLVLYILPSTDYHVGGSPHEVKFMKQFRNTPYYVTTSGQVYREGKNTPLKPDVTKHNSGNYHRVTLSMNGKTERYLVHRMVAEVYIPNPEGKPHINHIDNDPSNNDVSNLEWCTPSENALHSTKQGRFPNLIASKKVSENKFKASEEKFKKLLGTYFIRLENENPRNYVVFRCAGCHEERRLRTDSPVFNQLPATCRYCKYKARKMKI